MGIATCTAFFYLMQNEKPPEPCQTRKTPG